MKNKYLILGCNGMLGSTISLYLFKKGYNIEGFAKTKNTIIKTILGDAIDFDYLKKIIDKGNYDYVVNCIGILNKNAENNRLYAKKMNTDLPLYLKEITKNSKTKIIHISTDCVFDGKRGQYTESDIPNARTVYGKTKAEGEINDNKNLTLRTSIVGPDIKENGIGLFNWFMKQKGSIDGYSNVIWTGVTTLELAKIIERISFVEDACGLINMVNNETISKYELLKLFKKYTNKKDVVLNENLKKIENKSLNRTNFNFDYVVPSYEIMIKELIKWIRENKDYYCNYSIN